MFSYSHLTVKAVTAGCEFVASPGTWEWSEARFLWFFSGPCFAALILCRGDGKACIFMRESLEIMEL